MPPAGYPAFLQYLQSGRVSKEITKAVLHALVATRENSATAFPSSREADPARPSEPSPARPPGNNSR